MHRMLHPARRVEDAATGRVSPAAAIFLLLPPLPSLLWHNMLADVDDACYVSVLGPHASDGIRMNTRRLWSSAGCSVWILTCSIPEA